MADGLFDDLIPAQKPAPSTGLFDDLVPRPAVPNAFADVQSGIDSTEVLGSAVNVGDVMPVRPDEVIVPEGVAPGLGESLYRRAQAGLGSQVGGALRFLGESLAPDIDRVSPNVQAVIDAVLPQRAVGAQAATLGGDVTDFSGQLRAEAQSGQRPEGFLDAITNPLDTLRYYGGIAAESLPATLGALATRNPQAATAAIAGLTGAQAYGEQRGQGVSQPQALQSATEQALIEAAGSRGALEEAFTPGSFLARLPRVAAPESLGEAGTEVLQTVAERPNTPIGELLATALDAAIASAPGAVVETLGGATERAPSPSIAPPPDLLGGPPPEAVAPVGTNQESRPAPIMNRAEPQAAATTTAAEPLADLDALLAALSPDILAQVADLLGGPESPAVSPIAAEPPTAVPPVGEAAATMPTTRAADEFVSPAVSEGVTPQIEAERGTREFGRREAETSFEDFLGAMDNNAAGRAVQELREQAIEVSDEDATEAASLVELARRARDTGVDEFDLAPFANEPATDYARRLWTLTREAGNVEQRAAQEDRGERVPQGFTLEGQRTEAAGQPQAAAPAQVGLFGVPSARETVDAEARRRDAERSGATGTGRTDIQAGAGELFAGPRPQQTDLVESSEDDDYRMTHRAPGREEGAPLSDLTKIYPDDVYGPRAAQFYGHHGRNHPDDRATVRIIQSYRGNPDAPVTIYRAVPKGVTAINPGDWVTINKNYAKDHGESQFGDDYDVLQKQVKASEIYTNGDSIHEWGYDPQDNAREDMGPLSAATREVETQTLSADESRAMGEQDADARGFREAVNKVIGRALGQDVVYLRGTAGLPERLRAGIEARLAQRQGKGRTAALYDPKTQTTYLFTDVVASPERAAWNAAHEIAGHHGLRALLGDKLDHALSIARQNPTVKAVADAIAAERKLRGDQGLLATEEALAELAAAVRTGDYAGIESRYGVPVPEGVRAKLQAAIANFLKRLKAAIDDLFGRHGFTDEDVRALLESAWQAADGGPTLADTRAPGESVESTAPEQTQTAAFRRWFGDSKVVDANGAPLVVYHGSPDARFVDEDGVFKSQRERYGFGKDTGAHWFASSSETARSYMDPNRAFDYQAAEPGMVAAFLKIENPLIVDAAGAKWRDAQKLGKTGDIIAKAQADGHDGVIIRNVRDNYQTGVVRGDKATDTYLVFDSKQIKSATANRGTFDPGSPSILENVEQMPAAQVAREADRLPDDATGRSIIANGQLVPFLAAAKQAGADLSGVRDALQQPEPQARARALVAAIDALLPLEAKPTPEAKQPAPEPKRPSTGTKNEVVRAEREAAGKDPILAAARQSNESTLAQAEEVLQREPERGAELVERLARDGVAGVSAVDEAVLLIHKATLRQARDRAADRAGSPQLSDDARAVAERQWRELEAQLNEVDQATVAAGREWGRLGQFRQRMLRDDFTLEALERKERAREGRPLTRDESARLKEFADRIAELQAKADLLQTRLSNAESEGAYEALIKELSKAPKKRPTLERLRTAANESRAFLATLDSVPRRKNQSGATLDPRAVYHLSRIGAFHVANGAASFSDWLGRMKADVGDWLDNVRAQLPAVFQASKAQNEPRGDGPSVAAVRGQIDPEAVTPKDVRKLAEAHIREGLRGEPAVMQAVADSLGMDVDTARRLFVTTERRARTRTEVQQELADLRQIIRLDQEIARIQAGEPKATPAQRPQASAQVQAKRDELAAVRQRLRDAARPDPEQRYQELRGRGIQRRIQELQDRIAAGDFDKRPPRVPRALNEANQRAQFELDKAKEEFLRHQFEAELKKRSPLRKVFGGAVDTANFARALMTSLDLSGVLRQGGFISYGHPVAALKALGPSLKAFASEQSEHVARKEIESRPNFPLYKKAGLEFTGIGTGPLNKVEEAYASRWVDRFPKALGGGLIRGSGRSYTTFLNRLRADAFDAMAASLSRSATPTPEETKAIANYVNVATGRGKVGTSENAGQALNTLFFAPRLVASRFQLLAGQPLYGGSNRTRKLIAQEYARFMLGFGVATALAAFGLDADEDEQGQLIELDPRSSNFGKIHFGNTWLDPLAGLAQVTTLVSRLATGETKTGKGAVKPLRADYTLTDLRRAIGEDLDPHKLAKDGSLPFGSGSATDVIGRFLRTKLAPVPGAALNTLSGANVIGEKVTPAETAASLVTPMSFGDIGAIMEEQGVPRGTAITLLGLLGIGVQHREQKIDPAALSFNIESATKDELAKLPQERWAEVFAERKRQHPTELAGIELVEKADGTFRASRSGRPSFKTDQDVHDAAIEKAREAAED